MWTTPAATEMRFGFEVTMYVMNNNHCSKYYKSPRENLCLEYKNYIL